MSLPAADSPDPLAVLVLAWDEAAPAVRALVAATQTSAPALDSLLVMVPQADAPESLGAEEYLPIASAPPAAPLAPQSKLLSAAVPLPTTPAPLGTVALAPLLPAPVAAVSSPALPTVAAEPTATAEAAPLAWSAVRVVRLGNLSLPQLAARAGQPLPAPIWTGATAAPAAPYIGASEDSKLPLSNSLSNQGSRIVSVGLPHLEAASMSLLDAPDTSAHAGQSPLSSPNQPKPLPSPTQAPPLYDATTSITQAPDLEADLALAEAEELISLESVENSPLLLDEFSASVEPAPGPTDWEAALASLHQPAAPPETAVAAPAAPAEPVAELVSAAYPALRPAPQHYPAPDLNFQIIQYARFAVPVALAEPPFAVLYAPAWPTWLAAQELRQRTGRPLVLHVATLAAADDESVETATGWIAELQRQALRRADLLITETPALAQRLRRELALEASQVLAIPAAEAAAIAQALRGARVRPAAA